MVHTELQSLAVDWLAFGETSAADAARCATPYCHVRSEPESFTDVRLGGELPRDWSARLTQACAARGISLLRGYARRLEAESWVTHLKLDPGFAHTYSKSSDFKTSTMKSEPQRSSAAIT